MKKGYAIFNPSTDKYIAESDAIGLYEQDVPFLFDNQSIAEDIVADYETDIKCVVVTVKWTIQGYEAP